MLSKSQETGVRKLGVTQELLSLVTGLAHYLKLLIRISLQGALKLEKEKKSVAGLNRFLDKLQDLDLLKEADEYMGMDGGTAELAKDQSDLCYKCGESIDEECVKHDQLRWHKNHLMCDYCHNIIGDDLRNGRWSSSESTVVCRRCFEDRHKAPDATLTYEYVSRLKQYVYLLRVALARLLSVLRKGGALPHTSGMARRSSTRSHGLTVISRRSEPADIRLKRGSQS